MKKAGQFYVPDGEEIQLQALAAGGWQLDHLEAALAHVTDFSLAVDGGAHIGSWTCTMMKRFSEVHAFEPDKINFQCLHANTAGCDNVVRHELALGDLEGRTGMADDERYIGRGNTGGRHLKGSGKIRVVTLDSLALPSLGFLKLDVEGYELMALQGAAITIRRYKPIVMVEDKPRMAERYNLEPHAAQEFLAFLGLKFREKVGSDFIWGW